MSAADATVLLFMMAQNGSGGASRSYATTFPVGARLVNYSTFNNAQGFGATVATNGLLLNDSNQLVIAPAGGYWAFSWSFRGCRRPGMTGCSARSRRSPSSKTGNRSAR